MLGVNNDPMDETALRIGHLEKQGSRVKSWRRRLFVLTNNRLRYHENHSYEPAKGELSLADIVDVGVFNAAEEESTPRRGSFFGRAKQESELFTIRITSSSRELLLRGSQADMEGWLEDIKAAVARFKDVSAAEGQPSVCEQYKGMYLLACRSMRVCLLAGCGAETKRR